LNLLLISLMEHIVLKNNQNITLQRHFRVLTKFTHVESRLSGHKRQKEVVFDAP
jgi:hypothetical protein